MKKVWNSSLIAVLALLLGSVTAYAAMGKPKTVKVEGKIIDITCSAKGKVMMGNWHNAENEDHMTPDGEKKACATMCLKGGQPAGLFNGDDIAAVLACNPRGTLADYAAEDVQLQGFWAGGAGTKTFVPTKIRKQGSGKWQAVNCATMHG